jgi:hypothetical protein
LLNDNKNVKKILIGAALLIVVVGGCASRSSSSVAENYLEALHGKDWSGACRIVERESLKEIESIERRSCRESLEERWSAFPEQDWERGQVAVEEDGEWATAFHPDYGKFYLRKKGGWKISWIPPASSLSEPSRE